MTAKKSRDGVQPVAFLNIISMSRADNTVSGQDVPTPLRSVHTAALKKSWMWAYLKLGDFLRATRPTTNHMNLPPPTYEAKKPEVNWI